MFESILNSTDTSAESLPKSSFPWVWIGYLFAVAFLVAEIVMLVFGLEGNDMTLGLIPIALGGWIYWLFCVHRFHKILAEMSQNRHEIAPNEAVWKHLIPFYNFVWIFRWPGALSRYVNGRGRIEMASGGVLGILLLMSILVLRFFDGAIGLAGIFSVSIYISSRLRRHVAALRGIAAEMLPPPPDQSLFGYTATQPAAGEPIERPL